MKTTASTRGMGETPRQPRRLTIKFSKDGHGTARLHGALPEDTNYMRAKGWSKSKNGWYVPGESWLAWLFLLDAGFRGFTPSHDV